MQDSNHRIILTVPTNNTGNGGIEAGLIYSTGEYLFDHVFQLKNDGILKLIRFLYKHNGGIFSHRFAHILKYNNEIVGIELGYSGWQYLYHNFINIYHIIKYFRSPTLIYSMEKRSGDINKISAKIPFNEYYIAHFAVIPRFQEQGLGSRLMVETLARLKKLGYKKCSLDVSMDNISAQKFYEKHGFEVIQEMRDEKLEKEFGLHGRYRMVKEL